MGVPGTPANSTGPKIVLWQLSKEWIPGPEATVHVRGVGSRPSAGVGANPAVFPRQQLCSEGSQLRLDKSQLGGGGGEPSPTSYPQAATENVLKIRNILFTLLSMSNRQRSPSSQHRLSQPPSRWSSTHTKRSPAHPGHYQLACELPETGLFHVQQPFLERSLCGGLCTMAWGNSS